MFARAFGYAIRPITLGRNLLGLIQSFDQTARIPSSYVVKLHTDDHRAFADIEHHLVRELAEAATQFAEEHNYQHDDPLSVQLSPNSQIKKGSFEIEPQTENQPRMPTKTLDSPAKEIATTAPDVTAVLVLNNGDRKELTGTSLKVGRQGSCRIVLDDSNVSREHALLRRGSDGWMILDLNSTNGTKINGQKIDGEQLLVNGDELDFGTSHAKFEIS